MAKPRKKKSKPTKSRKQTAGKKFSPGASLRKHVVELLNEGQAHVTVRDVVADFPSEQRSVKADGLEHSGWQLLEHIRIAQWDILGFSRNPKHQSPEFPDGYWPKTATPDEAAWKKSVEAVEGDLHSMIQLVKNPRIDLHKPFPWGTGQTLLREAMLLADHNAYHLGQMVDLRRALGIWKK